jgi:DNA-binding SARP family transcriptional activator
VGRAKVHVFGRLRVVDAAGVERIPVGEAQRSLVLLLALRGGAVHLEQALDALWPRQATDAALGRMRNTLQRLRESCGPIVHREGASLILDADTDLADYEAAAVTMLALAPAELAPDALYAEWAVPTRRRLEAVRHHLCAGV